ncbi:MAG: thiamine ABC transporter ATP-binding protein [Rhodobacteraceae bacterium]|nr:thiamine ABC transporter ATP-binding protein [Paracoccaceae bacterium]
MLHLDHLVCGARPFRLEADLTVAKGRIAAVIGPSGAGKSTLLNTIAGFQPPTSGHILWQGDDLGPLAPGKRPVAMLFQDGNLFPHLDVQTNVALGIDPRGRLDADGRARVAEALARVGLDGLGGRKPGTLSGGQQSRAALARILVQHRPLILLDEPFAALGPALKADMLDLVADLARAQAATLLMITHDPEDARRIADDTIVVGNGRADPPRPTADILDNPPLVLQDYLAASA